MRPNTVTNINRVTVSQRPSAKSIILTGILYVCLFALAVICFLPFYMMFINATHESSDIAKGLLLTPGNYLGENYTKLMGQVNMWRGLLNSIIVAVGSTILAGYFGAMAAFGFSKYKFRGSKVLFGILIGSMMVPPQIGIVGFDALITNLNLKDTFWALIIPAIANASLVFFVKLYMDTAVPDSLIESARLDGCNEFAIFNKIVVPIAIPSIATMSMFTFIFSWNNYVTPSRALNSPDMATLPMMIYQAKGVYRTEFGPVYTAVAISIVPIMLVFAFCSKYIIGGLTAGAVKE